ncbi:hypothetical protein ANCCAN_13459 [Ancylostoma caninum]|uniref:Uncharacterized protein n=1 Tax=Ancylostoma caninum TaxID=29170 RepID=A0A368G853_ANCCA|nr:hypothetical protein ANCCAN_13459 [Ancylostoma caninum]
MDHQVVLAGEMALLIVGLTGLGMLHGWTEGVGYHMRAYYTPLWLCAVLMCLLLVLVISLFLVFVCLYCNHPGIIKQHIVLLLIVAIILFLENSLNLTKNAEHFESDETKSVVFTAWLVVLLWLLSILLSLVALFSNSYNLLLPHLIWTAILCVVCVCCSVTLLLSDTRPWTMIFCMGISVLLAVSVVFETKCFLAMRKCLH